MDVDIMPYSTTLFSKYHVYFKAVSDGWKEGCRPVIGLDGFFLKGSVRGEVLEDVGRDANNHIYPIARAVVGVENKATWKWFIDLLMDDIDGGLGTGITLLSDGHKLNTYNVPGPLWLILLKGLPVNISGSFFGGLSKLVLNGKGRDYDAIENGVSESFNSTIRHARRKPIITLLEDVTTRNFFRYL
uniref:MULE transposase domain-containing protein n=1 Tax=Lactuca sativa TaxID=4236 RepID=A0A9R1WP11_LACSA|nr:hypothetical protein LSAT_V11C900492850 [Lactuca sativa]